MSGLVGIGSTLNKQATDLYGSATALERSRRNEADMAEAAEDNQAMSMAMTGAGIGAMLPVPGGPIAGAVAGGVLGWLGSRFS